MEPKKGQFYTWNCLKLPDLVKVQGLRDGSFWVPVKELVMNCMSVILLDLLFETDALLYK